MEFRIVTNAFQPGGNIPVSNTMDGGNVSPYIKWEGAPAEARSFALIVEDPDAPGKVFTHWLVYDIPAGVNELPDHLPHEGTLDTGVRQGVNDFGLIGYGGPQPPAGKRHQYVFRLFALAKPPGIEEGLKKDELLAKLEEMGILARTEITGFYKSLKKVRAA